MVGRRRAIDHGAGRVNRRATGPATGTPPGGTRCRAGSARRDRLHGVMLYDCRTVAERDQGVAAAIEAVRAGDLVVLPTDTVYGVGADAFKAWAVSALLKAKGRGRNVPPPVLVG